MNVLSVWKWHFSNFLQIFKWRSSNHFLGKWGKALKTIYNQNLVIGSFLENGFEGTLSSKTNVLRVWKGHFSVFLQIFEWQSWNRFKGKWDNVFLKLPWTKKRMSEGLKMAFFQFLQIFVWRSWNRFLGKWSKGFNSI